MEDPSLTRAWGHRVLDDAPHAFEYVQAVRILERVYPDREAPGRFVDPSREVVRFAAHPTLAFPASEIQSLHLPGSKEGRVGEGEPARMEVNFFGLVGPSGVMPREYTRLVAERVRARDHAMAAFLDLFNNRAVSLHYRAWRKHRFDVAREQGEPDRLSAHALDLVGEGNEALRMGTDDLPADILARFAGLLGGRTRSAVALEQLLEGVFGVEARVEQFVGGWFPIEDRDQCALGEEDPRSALGAGAVAGDEVWDPQARVRVRMGPLTRSQYDAFLPEGRHHRILRALVRYFGNDSFEFEVQLVLRREEIPGLVLDDAEEGGHRLGWSTWIRTRDTGGADADETVLVL